MTQALRVDSNAPSALEESLRRSLRDALGNLEIRRRLVRLARDPERIAALREQLGTRHALLRELQRLDAEPLGAADQAPGEMRRVGSSSLGARPGAPQLWTPSTQS